MYSQKWNCAASLFPKQNYNVLCPNSYTQHLWKIYIFPGSVCLLAAAKYVDRSWEYINRSQTQNVEIGTEAAQFPEKECINGILISSLTKDGNIKILYITTSTACFISFAINSLFKTGYI
jgi:hypothetical protein